nr:hypothetical protein GCM10020063_107230 [Dactylosporangium thailandense]
MQPVPPPIQPGQPPKPRRRLKWYHFVIAGVVAVWLLCSCAGVVVYRQFQSGRASGDIAACELAIRGVDPATGAGRDTPEMAADYRKAADLAKSPDLRTAMLTAADAFDEAHAAADKSGQLRGTDPESADAAHTEAEALREMSAAYGNMMTLCKQAGWH